MLALGTTIPSPVQAASTEGVRQDDSGTIAINLYEVPAGGPASQFGSEITESNPGGVASATAEVLCAQSATCAAPGAIEQAAIGTQSASNLIDIAGTQTIHADAHAIGDTAAAIGYIDLAIGQLAVADDLAENHIEIAGLLDIHAHAMAEAAVGTAVAVAVISGGISQIATAGFDHGTASNNLNVGGVANIAAEARADSDGGSAAAIAAVGTGVYQQADGFDAARDHLDVSGQLSISADATAGAAGDGFAYASATAVGIVQVATARAQGTANGTGPYGTLTGVISDDPTGLASVELASSGSLSVHVGAKAVGEADASALAAGTGVVQVASGNDAKAAIANSGGIAIGGAVTATGVGSPRAVLSVGGIAQAATALATTTVETIHTSGTMTIEIGSIPEGPALAQLTNSGEIAIAGTVEVNAAASGMSGLTEAFGYAGIVGMDQTAVGATATALIDNEGTFTVVGSVKAISDGLANAQVAASGIDQLASAYANHVTAVFASGTTTPSYVTGNATAVGKATAKFHNAGIVNVAGVAEAVADGMAFAGATVAALGQGAFGTDAEIQLDNQGMLSAFGRAHSEGTMAFAGVGLVGVTQVAGGTAAASADIHNDGSMLFVGSAAGDGGRRRCRLHQQRTCPGAGNR
jgi:hypothetical protein